MSLPKEFVEQVTKQLGAQTQAFLAAMEEPYVRGVRLNWKKPAPAPEGLLERVPWAENAYYLDNDSRAGAEILHEAGAYYLQEPSAMAAAAALDVQKDDAVLDLCAAPGGKSTQMAARISADGVIVCNEPNPQRAQVLSSNIERMGIQNAVVISALPQELSKKWAGYFDKILVDAPCSGEGMFRRHKETREEWNAAAPEGCAQRQKTILDCAADMLAPGGRMAYSTCTFNRAENDDQIAAFLLRHPDFRAVPFALPGLPPAQNGTLHLWPHEIRGEGHFVALLEKSGEKEQSRAEILPKPVNQQEFSICQDFLREAVAAPCAQNASFMGRAVQTPNRYPPLDGVKVLRLGLHLGQVKGKLFVPDHALAMALPAAKTFEMTRQQALCWLHGEAISVPDSLRGWASPTFEGLQLGWGKASEGQLKNHYPKGLRK